MVDQSFEYLIQRHEMGQAYLRITEQMGPSPQLLAFVNHDTLDLNNIGLESFGDLEIVHQQIVDEINNDPSLNIALESFSGRAKSFAEKVKNIITFNKHAQDLESFIKPKLEERSSNIYVEDHGNFLAVLAAHQKLVPLMTWVLSRLPKTGELKVWEEFAKKNVQIGNQSEFDLKIKEIKKLEIDFKGLWSITPVEFKKSGWDATKFKSGISSYLSEIKKSVSDYNLANEVLDDLYSLIIETKELNISSREKSVKTDSSKDQNGKPKVTTKEKMNYSKREDVTLAIKGMGKAEEAVSEIVNLCFDAEVVMDKTLRHVAHHFEKA